MPIAIPIRICTTKLHLPVREAYAVGGKLGDPRLSRVEILTRTCKKTRWAPYWDRFGYLLYPGERDEGVHAIHRRGHPKQELRFKR